MKTLVLAVLAFSILARTYSAEGSVPPFPDFVNRINKVGGERDVWKALEILNEIHGFPSLGWGPSGGMCPLDRVNAAILALRSFGPFLSWRERPAKELSEGVVSPMQRWLGIEVQSTSTVLSMLESDDPLPKYIALEKIRAAREVSPELLPTLREVALNDDRIEIIMRYREPLLGERPGPEALYRERVFDAPFRRTASEILKSVGEITIDTDQRQLSIRGLAWLGTLYISNVDDPHIRFECMSAFLGLAESTPEIVEARRGASLQLSPKEWFARFQAMARGGTVSPAADTPPKSKVDNTRLTSEREKTMSTALEVVEATESKQKKRLSIWHWLTLITGSIVLLGVVLFALRRKRPVQAHLDQDEEKNRAIKDRKIP